MTPSSTRARVFLHPLLSLLMDTRLCVRAGVQADTLHQHSSTDAAAAAAKLPGGGLRPLPIMSDFGRDAAKALPVGEDSSEDDPPLPSASPSSPSRSALDDEEV